MDAAKKIMNDPFNYGGDERAQMKSSGYTRIEDGQSIKLRVTTNIYAYFTFQPEGYKMPLKNSEVKELLEVRSVDELFEDQTMTIRERYAAVVWNHETSNAEVWQFSRTVFEQLKTLNEDNDWQGGLNAHDVKVTRKGQGTDTAYTINYSPSSQALTADQENALLEVDVQKMVAGARRL